MDTVTIPFEIHITIAGLQHVDEETLQAFCSKHDARLLLIELARGTYINQPMFSKVIMAASLPEAMAEAQQYVGLLKDERYTVSRLKIEVPAQCADRVTTVQATTGYYEWHGRVDYNREPDLLDLCRKHSVHLSRNALRKEHTTRFITLREYGPDKTFMERIAGLLADLETGGWTVHKAQHEYCVYDSNVMLDKGWLS